MIEGIKPGASISELEEHMKKIYEEEEKEEKVDGLTHEQRMAFALCGMYRLKDGSWIVRGYK